MAELHGCGTVVYASEHDHFGTGQFYAMPHGGPTHDMGPLLVPAACMQSVDVECLFVWRAHWVHDRWVEGCDL
jgi:hypothetical protein